MKPYTLPVPAGVEEEYAVEGTFVRLDDTSAINVTVRDRATDYTAVLKPGDAVIFPQKFMRLSVSHEEVTEQLVTLDIGRGQLVSSRIAGSVTFVQGSVLSNSAPVAVGSAAAIAVAAADSSRRALHLMNRGTAVVYLGGAGVTAANAAIELQPGEEWREEVAAAAAWYAITASGASSVTVMGMV